MAKTTDVNLNALRKRLNAGQLTKSDLPILDELISSKMEFEKSMKKSLGKIGNKTIIAKLPFGYDIVK